MTIGIIGAGICGLMAARELKKSGHDIWLLDKSREVGGRMATRRVEVGEQTAVFDHGAQFFTSRDTEFLQLIEEMQNARVVREWFRGFPSDEIPKDEKHPRFCGESGMTDVPKFLSRDLEIHLDENVRRIDWFDRQWRVTTGGTAQIFWCDALILTPPVPQSLEIIKRGTFEIPVVAQTALQKITYEPCWAVLAQLYGPSNMPAPGALHLEHETLAWIADNYQKGISPLSGSVTIHARGDWSEHFFSITPEQASRRLLEAARDYLGNEVVSAQAHRWRYAKPRVTHPKPYLVLSKPSPLIFAGDAFLSAEAGPRVEGAALSGLAAGKYLCNLYTKC